MGRYLDLIRDPDTAATTEPAKCDISDISDQSHAEVEPLEHTKAGNVRLVAYVAYVAPKSRRFFAANRAFR
jgi:hypothetical protein